MSFERNNEDDDANSRFAKLKAGASHLSIYLQSHFWAFVSNQARLLINQKSDAYYDVMTSNSPNPLASAQSVEASGEFNVVMRALRVLLIPFQKALQYYAWSSANKDYEENYAGKIAALEMSKKQIEDGIWYANDVDKVAEQLGAINQSLERLQQENENRNRDEVAGIKKPTFTWQDAMYLALDIVLLALAIAALVYGASIPGAAIAVTAATISGVVAGVSFGKFVYAGYQLKKEDERLTSVIGKINRNENLDENDRKFVEEQKEKAKLENPKVNFDGKSDADILMMRQDVVQKSLKQNIGDRYKAMRKTLGLGLTVMSIVSASLILCGIMLGPFGVPVIAAGVGLGLVTTGIAVGMMIVNYVKTSRDNKLARESALPMLEVNTENATNDMKVVPTNRVVNDRLFHQEVQPHAGLTEKKVERSEVPKPFVPPEGDQVHASSIFNKRKLPEDTDGVELQEFKKPDGPQ